LKALGRAGFAIGIGVGIGIAITLAAVALIMLPRGNILDSGSSSSDQQGQYQSIEIDMPKTTYAQGERLNFTIQTNGICASPNVSVWREEGNGQSILVYQYIASPISCPRPEKPDEPHLVWHANQLVQRISDDNFGGDGDSVITISSAFPLKKTGNYTISSSLPDQSKEVTKKFSVISTDSKNGNAPSEVKCGQLSLCTYQLKVGNTTYPINFRMNGTIEKMAVDMPTQTLTINVKVDTAGSLQIAVPREIVDPRTGPDGKSGSDMEFAIFLDAINVDAVEHSTKDAKWANFLGIADHPEKYRILVIAISENAETVEIVGTIPI
jgi:hypothetical protein